MEADPDSRQYNKIWRELKAKGRVSIASPRPLHKRILKAVKKEKWLDIGFKLELGNKTAILSHAQSGSILTFFLEIKPHSLDLRVTKKITTSLF